jgi:hypothetical protein
MLTALTIGLDGWKYIIGSKGLGATVWMRDTMGSEQKVVETNGVWTKGESGGLQGIFGQDDRGVGIHA